jgi:zinc transport system substrate-binding protein
MLTAGQRADLQTADVVLTLGNFGFQPDIEKAAADANGHVVNVTAGLSMLPSSEDNLGFDPHVWLDPILMKQIVGEVANGLIAADPAGRTQYEAGAKRTEAQLSALDKAYSAALGDCAFTTFVATHQAFGYLAQQYGLHQLGVEGLTPESEPTAASIQNAINAIRDGTAAPAVFYEATDAGKRIGESVAGDANVQALPLGTLEAAPSTGDYVSIVKQNLASLEKGLQCRPAPTP